MRAGGIRLCIDRLSVSRKTLLRFINVHASSLLLSVAMTQRFPVARRALAPEPSSALDPPEGTRAGAIFRAYTWDCKVFRAYPRAFRRRRTGRRHLGDAVRDWLLWHPRALRRRGTGHRPRPVVAPVCHVVLPIRLDCHWEELLAIGRVEENPPRMMDERDSGVFEHGGHRLCCPSVVNVLVRRELKLDG